MMMLVVMLVVMIGKVFLFFSSIVHGILQNYILWWWWRWYLRSFCSDLWLLFIFYSITYHDGDDDDRRSLSLSWSWIVYGRDVQHLQYYWPHCSRLPSLLCWSGTEIIKGHYVNSCFHTQSECFRIHNVNVYLLIKYVSLLIKLSQVTYYDGVFQP